MQRRLVEPGELEPGIMRRAALAIIGERLCVAGGKIRAHCFAAPLVLDDDEAPGLAEADRRREAGERDQSLERTLLRPPAAKAPDVAPPGQEIAELVAKRRIEGGGVRHVSPRCRG